MLIDTGADSTLIPRICLPYLGIADGDVQDATSRLVGFDGALRSAQFVEIEIHVFDRRFRGEFYLYEGNYGILGRDILNLVHLSFDGPNAIWQVITG